MSDLQDFKNVFGNSLTTFTKRFFKGASVFEKMMKGADLASDRMPIRLQIEVTDKCNYDCIMCNRLTRKNVRRTLNNDMTLDVFENLIETIKPFYVTLNGLGEPLLNKEIDKMLSVCRQKMITTSMPCNLSVSKVLNTKIVKEPPSIITFSVHGASKEVFEAISRKSDYEKSITNFRQFLALTDKKDKIIRVLCALQAKNLFEYRNMYKLLSESDLLKNFCLVPVYDYGGTDNSEAYRIIPTESEKEKAIICLNKDIELCKDVKEASFYIRWKNVINQISPYNTDGFKKMDDPCMVPWFSTYIAANGNVLPCCYLLDEHYILGNIFDKPFDLIWNGEEYKKFRKSIRENRELMQGCNYCYRSDLSRIKKYGFPFRRSMIWKI